MQSLDHSGGAKSVVNSSCVYLPNEEIEACREAFARFDLDNSGAIDTFELQAALRCARTAPAYTSSTHGTRATTQQRVRGTARMPVRSWQGLGRTAIALWAPLKYFKE